MNGPRYAWRWHRTCDRCGRGFWTAPPVDPYRCPDCRGDNIGG